ncbi:hypothetical protein SERLA73DRAFT_179341 [Serpula lacrymans var. lacrymans S7.3]|uniref:Uncharacterized protein n=2 Tax=Serpula lacrymans var. lacrymans TaxID=341189 RepID=F8PS39_SERL3|nr:uncharacterized protein SERLADRAFT_464424 [Serpula lacrymans var. lacrymans S7.9]EGO01221.1 hypothetical protein SERLA73DRAFT_179341 [Serpula lacrymans var. lacrymans S7.3]EGO26870.1 hypothetical protein SERLADRAFT_464424 [Serpula lacrymans var. lacrymans S7.9]
MTAARENGIRSWMIEHGWEAEVNYFTWDFIAKLPIISAPKLLTPRALGTISKPLNEWMDNLRNIRLEETVYSPRRRILMETYKVYLRMSPQAGDSCELMPHVADVAAFKPFDDIIKSPSDVVVNASTFLAAFPQLPTLVSNWRQKIDRDLVDTCINLRSPYLPPAPAEEYSSILSRLRLAVSVFAFHDDVNFFSSRSPRHMLLYPDILRFRTFIEPCRFSHFNHTPNATSIAQKIMGGHPWSVCRSGRRPSTVKYFSEAASIIHACGMDPSTATVNDMNRLDPRLRCDICIVSKHQTVVMTWRTAVGVGL